MKIEKIISIIFISIGGFYFFLSSSLPYSSRFFPRFIIYLLVILSAILLVKSFIITKSEEEKSELNNLFDYKFLGTVLITFVYIILINWFGFYFSTFIFLISLMYFLKRDFTKSLVFIPIITTLILYGVFNIFLKVPTPHGFLF